MDIFIVFLLISFFSIIIVYKTIHSLSQVFNIAIKRKEISKQRYRFLVPSSLVVSISIATALPLGYYKLFETI